MTEQEFHKLMKKTKKDLALEIWNLQNRVSELEKQNSDMGWRLNPDRMGGQFTQEEIDRSARGGEGW